VAAIGKRKVELLVDLGTGTGRVLELLSATYARGIGFDLSPAMLSYARSKLDRAGVAHAQVRQGDILDVPLADATAGIVVMHQILHFLPDPQRALQEAVRILAPGGTLLVIDFAPHGLEFVRDAYAHERLGFADTQMRQWMGDCGLGHVTSTHLNPRSGEAAEKLTVSLWLASADATAKTDRTLELTS
jgi:ubiquinone/menaquinone biosynthesis C-methylase UbiE